MAKITAPRSFLEGMVYQMAKAPAAYADPSIVQEVKAAVSKGLDTYSDGQLFDILQRIGDLDPETNPMTSKFVRTVCNLALYYTRPTSELNLNLN